MKKTFWTFLVIPLFFSAAAHAQPFGFGIKLGTTLTDALSSAHSFTLPSANHIVAGPYVEVRLPLGLSLEGDALYESGIYSSSALAGGSTWQFPVVLKRKFLKGPVKPYIEGGVAFSHISDLAEIPALNHRSNYGIVLGGGVELKVLMLRISPEIRYNGWTLTNLQDPLGQFQSNRNQAMFQVGIGF